MASPATAHPARPRHHHRHRPRAGGRSADGQVLGVLLMVFGLGWFLRVTGAVALSWESLLSAVLIVLGVGMVVTARARAGGLMMALGILLTVALATTSSVGEFRTAGGVGDPTYVVDSATQLRPEYRLFAGELTLDLSELSVEDATEIEAGVTFGQVTVIVPADVAVEVTATATAGRIELFGDGINGNSLREQHVDDDFNTGEAGLSLDLSATFGELVVTRAPARPAISENTGSDDASRS